MTGPPILNPIIGPTEHTFTAAEIDHIGDCLYAWTGMVFRESKRYFIERRVSDRMTRCAKLSVDAYLGYATAHRDEREALISAFTINESYFYREDHQFSALSTHILPDISRSKRPGDKVRILSLPCSTGDEPYSIAIWLLENWAMVDAYNVEIVGSDIDNAAMAAARRGWFGAKALSRLAPELIEAYFGQEQRHRHQIIEPLRESVQFIPANIVDQATLAPLGTFDVIFCRNLLIYFDDQSRHRAVENLFDCLNPGGFICLGHSESLARITDRFAMVRYDNTIVYRRP